MAIRVVLSQCSRAFTCPGLDDANPIAKACFDAVEPVVEKMPGPIGIRLRQDRRRARACGGAISAGVPTPELGLLDHTEDYAATISNHFPAETEIRKRRAETGARL